MGSSKVPAPSTEEQDVLAGGASSREARGLGPDGTAPVGEIPQIKAGQPSRLLDGDKKLSARVLSINWGPWGGVGMVRPELEREYERRGVGLIAPEDGVTRFFEELCLHRDAQVILTATAPGMLQ